MIDQSVSQFGHVSQFGQIFLVTMKLMNIDKKFKLSSYCNNKSCTNLNSTHISLKDCPSKINNFRVTCI